MIFLDKYLFTVAVILFKREDLSHEVNIFSFICS